MSELTYVVPTPGISGAVYIGYWYGMWGGVSSELPGVTLELTPAPQEGE